MKSWKLFSAAMLTAAMAAASWNLCADEGEKKPQNPPPQREGRGPREGRAPRMEGREMNPEVIMAMMLRKELKAYQENPTDENFAALEKALGEAQKKFAARHKEELTKRIAALQEELKTFEGKQAEVGKVFLEKVKKGEFKMPERPPKMNRPMDGKGPRGPQAKPNREGTPDGELPPPPMVPEK